MESKMIQFNGHEYEPEEFTLVNCAQCAKPYVWPNAEAKIIALGLCADCYRAEWGKRNKKQCRICGDYAIAKDSKEDTCADCKAAIADKPTETPVMAIETKEPDPSLYTKLATLKDEAGDQWSMIGIRASNIKAENVNWMWPLYIPLGMGVIFAGRPGGGKSSCAIDFAARVSRGADWPDGTKNTLGPRNVLYFSTEDGKATTLKPRLMAANADCAKVFFYESIIKKTAATGKVEQKILNLKQHIALLEKALHETKNVGLVVLDPLSSFIGIDMNKDKEAREVMDRLARLLDNKNVTFVSILHHNKKPDVSSIEKILGASSLVASTRIIWDFSRDPDDRELRHMSLVKDNIGKEPPGFKYQINEKEIDGIKCSHVEWGDTMDENADELLARSRDKNREHKEGTSMIAAKLFLRTQLENGERKSSGDDGLIEMARREGIPKTTLWRAKEDLKLVWVRRGGDYYWSLPRPEQQIPADVDQVM
jgi:KaiC/GvpD/RAD55 family RecA-like ATPase